MSKKSKIIVFLALLLLVSAMFLQACKKEPSGGEDDKTPQNSAGGEGSETPAESRKWLDDAPERDFGGYAFRMFLRGAFKVADMYVEEETGEPVDDAVWLRNKIVEDRFNINIEPVWFDDGMATAGEKSILAGEDAWDTIAHHAMAAYMYVNKNLTLDWIANMTHVDLTKSWWNQNMVEDSTYFGRLYAVTGDITYSTLVQTLCLFFNKELFKNLDIPYPYDDVKNGKWTYDRFIEICRQGTAELNGDGVMTWGEDRYGFAIFNQFTFPVAGLYIGGDKVVKKDENNYPVLSMYTPRTVSIYEKLFDMLDSEIAFCVTTAMTNAPLVNPVFASGLALFCDNGLSGAVELRGMDAEIGILPYPKYDGQTPRYYSLLEAGASTFIIPITNRDLERTSIILEAMASEGQRTVIPAYYELTLKGKHARDDESYDMLDIIKDSIVVDWGYLNGDVTGQLGLAAHYMIIANNKNFASFYEKHEAAVQANIQKFIEKNEH